jgi:hypothetical protein
MMVRRVAVGFEPVVIERWGGSRDFSCSFTGLL